MIKKSHYLKTYYNNSIKNIYSSKFIYDCVNDIPKIESLRLTIESSEIKKTHFLAIYILSKGFLPYMKKYNKRKSARVLQTQKGDRFFFSDIKKYNVFFLLSFFFQKLATANLNTEQSPYFLKKNQTKLVLWNTPLVDEIKKLQSPQGYIPSIPIGFSFKLSKKNKNTLYERLFFLRSLGFLNFQEITDLDFAQ